MFSLRSKGLCVFLRGEVGSGTFVQPSERAEEARVTMGWREKMAFKK